MTSCACVCSGISGLEESEFLTMTEVQPDCTKMLVFFFFQMQLLSMIFFLLFPSVSFCHLAEGSLVARKGEGERTSLLFHLNAVFLF